MGNAASRAALTQQTEAQPAPYERVNDLLRRHGAEPAAVEAELEQLLDELRDLSGVDPSAVPSYRYAASMAALGRAFCGPLEDEERAELLERCKRELQAVNWRPDEAVVNLAWVALHMEQGCSLQAAVRSQRWILEQFEVDPALETELWLRAARMHRGLGQWVELEQALAEAYALVSEPGELPGGGARDLAFAQRSRHALEVARSWMELGLLDLSQEWLAAARSDIDRIETADGSFRLPYVAAAELAQADYFNLSRQFDAATDSMVALLENDAVQADANYSSIAALYMGMAQSESERVDPARTPEAEDSLRWSLELGLSSIHALKARLALADLALRTAEAKGGDSDAEQLARMELELAEQFLGAQAVTGGGCGAVQGISQLAAYRGRLALLPSSSMEAKELELERTGKALDAVLEEWRGTPQRRGGIGFMHLAFRRMLLRVHCDLAVAVEGPERGAELAFEAMMRAQSLGTLLDDVVESTAPNARAVRAQLLGKDRGALILLPSKYRSLLFVADSEDVQLISLESWARLQELTRPLRDGLLRPFARDLSVEALAKEKVNRAASVRSAAEEVAAVLFPSEVCERLRAWRHVTVTGTEFVWNVPFECVPWSEGRLLGQTHAVEVISSLPLQLALGRRALARGADDAGAVLVAHLPAVPDQGLRAATAAEFRTVAGLLQPFAREDRAVLTGVEAAVGRLSKRVAKGARPALLHFFAHGAYARELERGAQILLPTAAGAGLEPLDCEAIERLDLAGRCVVLSACATARGVSRLGDDNLAHLGGAFLRAGAECVVLSRAELELDETMALMQLFHARLKAGDPPSEALRAARVEYGEQQGSGWSDFSAGRVQLFGSGDSPLSSLVGSAPK